MSLPKRIVVNCSKCEKQLNATVFQSVNTDYADDIAAQIMSGKLFDIECPNCKFVSHLEYDMLYNDMRHGAAVWVVHKNSPQYDSKIAEIRTNQAFPYKTLRIVEDMNSLKEKVACLEYGRDDRIIELCKVFTAYNLLAQQPDFKIKAVFYSILSGKELIYLYDYAGNEQCCELPANAYDYLKELYENSSYAAQFDGNYAIVDYAWAEEILIPLMQVESERVDGVAEEKPAEPETVTESKPRIICPNCKSTLPEDSEFCQYCGSKIAAVTEQPKAPETPVAPVAPAVKITIQETASVKHQSSDSDVDDEQGLVPKKPIYTNGADQQRNYLRCLRSINGETLNWNHRGSIKIDGVQGLVDIYDAYLPSGAEYRTVYLNGSGIACPAYAPKGFSYVSTPYPTAQTNPSVKKQKSAKGKKAVKILIIIGVIAVIFAIGILVGIQEYHYQIAHQYFDNKNYDAAYSAFEDLGAYRDSEDMLESILNIKYKNLQQAMQSINGNNYKTIGAQIDEFPLDYRDISSIKTEYNQLKKNIEVIQSTSVYTSRSTMTERGCTALRNAYANLMNFNNKNNDWDLSSYLKSVHDKYLFKLIFGVEWKTTGGSRFYWYEDEDSARLSTSLPNDMDDNKDYFYYTSSPDKFGYENQKNSSDKFLAYRITEVIYSNGTWQVKIYCYSESRTLTLSPS